MEKIISGRKLKGWASVRFRHKWVTSWSKLFAFSYEHRIYNHTNAKSWYLKDKLEHMKAVQLEVRIYHFKSSHLCRSDRSLSIACSSKR